MRSGAGKGSKRDADLTEKTLSARARREFLQRFFHDLATPLSAVSLHLEGADRRVRRGTDPSESLAVARAELAKAFELFDRGREFLLEAEQPPESFSFDEFVTAAAHRNGAEPVRVEGTTGGRVRADRRALTEALSALLTNAIEASGASAVRVVLERAGHSLKVRIENPGRLPADNPEMLFSPRAASPGKNWGMGLPRARLLAADAGGGVTLAQDGEHLVVATLELPEETA